MPPPISQSIIIEKLNAYLEWHNFPGHIHLSKKGMCNGLSSVCAMYTVMGNQDAFRKKIEQLASIDASSEIDIEINHFVAQVIMCQNSTQFDPQVSQTQSLKYLQIEGKSLSSAFHMGLVTSKQNWEAILKEINLEENEAIIVRSPIHAITVSKSDKGYYVYDPDCKTDFKFFANEKELVNGLSRQVFMSHTDQLGMSLDVVRNPNAPAREFPDAKQLYDKYIEPKKVARYFTALQFTSLSKSVYDSLFFTIMGDDIKAWQALKDKDFTISDMPTAINYAIIFNSPQILKALLSNFESRISEKELKSFMQLALRLGNIEIFELLIANKPEDQRKQFISHNAYDFILFAAYGGNVTLMRSLITVHLDQELTGNLFRTLNPIQLNMMVLASIAGGSPQGIKLILDQIKNPLSEKQLYTYLTEAIKKNNPKLVEFFIDEIEHRLSPQDKSLFFKALQMNIESVERLDLSTLQLLKSSGVEFSKDMTYIMERKEKRSSSFSLSMGVRLTKFTDFIKEFFTFQIKEEESVEKFKQLKAELQNSRGDTPQKVEESGQEKADEIESLTTRFQIPR